MVYLLQRFYVDQKVKMWLKASSSGDRWVKINSKDGWDVKMWSHCTSSSSLCFTSRSLSSFCCRLRAFISSIECFFSRSFNWGTKEEFCVIPVTWQSRRLMMWKLLLCLQGSQLWVSGLWGPVVEPGFQLCAPWPPVPQLGETQSCAAPHEAWSINRVSLFLLLEALKDMLFLVIYTFSAFLLIERGLVVKESTPFQYPVKCV